MKEDILLAGKAKTGDILIAKKTEYMSGKIEGKKVAFIIKKKHYKIKRVEGDMSGGLVWIDSEYREDHMMSFRTAEQDFKFFTINSIRKLKLKKLDERKR